MQAVAMPEQTTRKQKILPKETSLSIHQNTNDILLINTADGTTTPLTGKHTVIECGAGTNPRELEEVLDKVLAAQKREIADLRLTRRRQNARETMIRRGVKKMEQKHLQEKPVVTLALGVDKNGKAIHMDMPRLLAVVAKKDYKDSVMVVCDPIKENIGLNKTQNDLASTMVYETNYFVQNCKSAVTPVGMRLNNCATAQEKRKTVDHYCFIAKICGMTF